MNLGFAFGARTRCALRIIQGNALLQALRRRHKLSRFPNTHRSDGCCIMVSNPPELSL
jgi:hypothetical protein